MSDIKTLLELRSRIKARKPKFIRQDTNIRIRVKNNTTWRKPKGIHSKMRHHRRGKRKMPSPGYGSPAKVKGLHSSGLKPAMVENESQIPDSKEYGIIISGKVGMRKKALIIKKANEKGIRILNIDAGKFMKKFDEFIAAKHNKAKEGKKEEKKEVKQEKTREKDKQITGAEEKKMEEKKEKDKILTKKA